MLQTPADALFCLWCSLAACALATQLPSLHLETKFHPFWEMCSFSCSRAGTSPPDTPLPPQSNLLRQAALG